MVGSARSVNTLLLTGWMRQRPIGSRASEKRRKQVIRASAGYLRRGTWRGVGEAGGRPRQSRSHSSPGRWGRYRAAVTMISTLYWGAASPASTVARAGVFPADTQPSHTAFISAKFFISVR